MLDSSATPDALPAVSSPAPVVSSPASLDSLNETELQAWRMDGKFPTERQAATPPADSSPATPETAQAASTDAPTESASKPAWDPATLKAETKKRFDEILAGQARERDRADRAERALADTQRQRQPTQDARPAAPSPAPVGLVKPDPEAFAYGTSDPGYLDARDEYNRRLVRAEIQSEWEQGQQRARDRAEHQRVETAFRKRLDDSRGKHADYDAVALTNVDVPEGSLAQFWIKENPAGAEILYHLQQPANASERRRIYALPYADQIVELVHLGDRLTSDAPAASSTASLPAPVPALTTRATPADAVERSLADGTSDEATGRYIEAQNRRDLARLKR